MASMMAVPVISQDNLAAFHTAHFAALPTEHFTQHFLGLVDEENAEETEDDGLGYYEDGVKRTLTDQQIAIFRHSEIQALLRDRRHAQELRDTPTPGYEDGQVEDGQVEDGQVEDGELEAGELPDRDDSNFPVADEAEIYEASTRVSRAPPSKNNKKTAKKAKKAEIAKQKGFFKQNVKPDLRKRTWDKVDAGVGNLDYDENSGPAQVQATAPQRRRISYDD